MDGKYPKRKKSAHGKSPPNLSKEWWRSFIRQCSAAGYISRVIKPVTYGTTIQGSYASLQPTEKGRGVVNLNQSVLLPQIDGTILKTPRVVESRQMGRIGLANEWGRENMLPFLKDLLTKKENWGNIPGVAYLPAMFSTIHLI